MKIKKIMKYIFIGSVLVGCGYAANMVHYTNNYVMIERTTAENVEKYNKERVEEGEDILLQDRYVLIDKTEIGHFSTLFEAFNEMKKGYIEDLNTKTLVDGAISGMVSATGDRHTVYTPFKKGEETFSDKLGKSYKGIGAEVTTLDGYLVITNPYKGAPAYNAGIRSYDRILKIDGKEVTGLDLTEVIGRIKGEKGSTVLMTIEREGTEVFDVTVVRDEIKNESIQYELVERGNKKVGIIEIMSFGEETAKDFKGALKSLEGDGIESLVIDVRDNGGGYLGAVQSIASELLPKDKVILELKEREGDVEASKSSNFSKAEKPYPIVVVVNENSASASEVLASALKVSGGYQIVGKKTFGKGTVQELVELEDGSEIRMTHSKWLTPDGVWVHEKGVAPTHEIEQSQIKNIPSLRIGDKDGRTGDVSVTIKGAQVVLNVLGYSLNQQNGFFDEQTREAILKYQSDKGLNEIGILDEPTIVTLNNDLLRLRKDKEFDDQLNEAIGISIKE